MRKSTIFMLIALLLAACLVSAGCLSFPFPGSKSTGSSSQATKAPTGAPTLTPLKTPTPTKTPTPLKTPCRNCISGRSDGGLCSR